ncbi:hypothetical protein OIU78_011825 [Salix suchowensis]|nr:hypothetical protein OIU78_011825 [Salix suchowensis]
MIKMDSSKISVGHIALISILFAGVLYLCTWSASISSPFLFSSRRLYNHCSSRSQSDMENLKVPVDELGLALEKASTPNKTVIIAVVNKAYVEQGVDAETTMFDLFLESFWLGEDTRPLLDHLLIIAVDQAAYERCLFKRLNCYKLETEGADQFEGEKDLHVTGFYQDDVEKNSFVVRSSQAWIQLLFSRYAFSLNSIDFCVLV